MSMMLAILPAQKDKINPTIEIQNTVQISFIIGAGHRRRMNGPAVAVFTAARADPPSGNWLRFSNNSRQAGFPGPGGE